MRVLALPFASSWLLQATPLENTLAGLEVLRLGQLRALLLGGRFAVAKYEGGVLRSAGGVGGRFLLHEDCLSLIAAAARNRAPNGNERGRDGDWWRTTISVTVTRWENVCQSARANVGRHRHGRERS